MTEDETGTSSWIHLNVGGKKFSTAIDTLTQREPESMLAAMFSGRHALKKEQGYVLIDRDGDYFGYVLNWLRDGDVPTLDARTKYQLLKEAEYFQLVGLIDRISRHDDADFTRKDVIKCIQSQQKAFRGVNLTALDLSNLDLGRINFSRACLRNVSFLGANLQGSSFDNADARGAIFSDSDLSLSDFTGAKLDGADFTNANMQGAELKGATLSQAVFTNAKLQGANLRGATLSQAVFRNANLSFADLNHADLTNADMLGAIRN